MYLISLSFFLPKSVCMNVCVCMHVHVIARVWVLEDNLKELVLLPLMWVTQIDLSSSAW